MMPVPKRTEFPVELKPEPYTVTDVPTAPCDGDSELIEIAHGG